MRPIPDKTRAKARRLRREGLGVEAIARRLHKSKSAVHRIVADLGVDRRAEVNRARASIPPAWIDDALKLLADGLSRNAAAARLGVPKSVFYRAIDKFST